MGSRSPSTQRFLGIFLRTNFVMVLPDSSRAGLALVVLGFARLDFFTDLSVLALPFALKFCTLALPDTLVDFFLVS